MAIGIQFLDMTLLTLFGSYQIGNNNVTFEVRPLYKMMCCICNSYTIGCPPVRGDNPQALASGLSYVQVDKHGITILYHLHQCRPCTSQDISC